MFMEDKRTPCQRACDLDRELNSLDMEKLPYWDSRRIEYEKQEAANLRETALLNLAKAHLKANGGTLNGALNELGLDR